MNKKSQGLIALVYFFLALFKFIQYTVNKIKVERGFFSVFDFRSSR